MTTTPDAPEQASTCSARDVYRIRVFFRLGTKMCREMPGIVFGGAALFWMGMVLPQLLSGALASLLIRPGRELEFVMSGKMLILVAPQWFGYLFAGLATAGTMVATAHYARSGEKKYSLMFTSFGSWLRRSLYQVIVAVLLTVGGFSATMLLVAPMMCLGGAAGDSPVMLGLAGVGALLSLLVVGILMSYGAIGLYLGTYAATLDGGLVHSLQSGTKVANGIRTSLFSLFVVYALMLGVAAVPENAGAAFGPAGGVVGMLLSGLPVSAVNGFWTAAMVSMWLLATRSKSELRDWHFFTQEPLLVRDSDPSATHQKAANTAG